VRKYSGELVTIPNGQIQQIGNMNRGFMRAIVEVSVAYEAGIDRAMAVMQELGRDWASAHSGDVLAPPEVQGIIGFRTDHVAIRLVVTVAPGAYVRAERELRLRVKAAFDAAGIARLSPSRVLNLQESAASRAATPDA
jgi:small conductance mechanosensitive channel